MKTTFILLVACLIATPALAQDIDWDLNNWGIFFDEAGTQTAAMATPGSVVNAYLVVLNPDFTQGVTGWSTRSLRLSGFSDSDHPVAPVGAALPMLIFARGGGIIVTFVDCNWWWDGVETNVLCLDTSLATPLFMTGNTVLADLTIVVTQPGPLGIFHTAGTTLWLDDGTELPLGASTYPRSTMPPMWWLAATINSEVVPVETEGATWGQVKAIYR